MKKIINNKKYISSQTDLTKEWCFEKNKGKNPTHILIDSDEVVWWKCSKEHEWQAQINDRNRGNNCPYCSKKSKIVNKTILLANLVLHHQIKNHKKILLY